MSFFCYLKNFPLPCLPFSFSHRQLLHLMKFASITNILFTDTLDIPSPWWRCYSATKLFTFFLRIHVVSHDLDRKTPVRSLLLSNNTSHLTILTSLHIYLRRVFNCLGNSARINLFNRSVYNCTRYPFIPLLVTP